MGSAVVSVFNLTLLLSDPHAGTTHRGVAFQLSLPTPPPPPLSLSVSLSLSRLRLSRCGFHVFYIALGLEGGSTKIFLKWRIAFCAFTQAIWRSLEGYLAY